MRGRGLCLALAALCCCAGASPSAAERGGVLHDGSQSAPRPCEPRLAMPARVLSILRGGSVDLRGVRVLASGGDEDLEWGSATGGYAEAVVSVTVRADRGRLALAPGFEEMLPSGQYEGPSTELRLEGLRGVVNSLLFGLRYHPPPGLDAQEDTVEVSALVIDHGDEEGAELCQGTAASASASIAIRVREQPFEPRLLLNHHEIGVGNVLAATEGGDVVSLEGARIDAGPRQAALVRVELFAEQGAVGQLTRSPSAGDALQASLRLVGTADEVNEMLARCIYAPPPRRSGEWDRILLIVQYNPRPGGGASLKWDDETTAVLPVRISAVVRPPTVYWAESGRKLASKTLARSSLLMLTPLPELSIDHDREEDDADIAAAGFQLIVRVDHGSLAWDNGTAVDGDRQAVELRGSTAELVETYHRIHYRAPSSRFLLFSLPDFSSAIDRIIVSLQDPRGRYRTGLNETIQLDIKREIGWRSAKHTLVRRSLVIDEDKNASIAELLDLSLIHLVEGNFSLRVSAQHGQIQQVDELDGLGAIAIEAEDGRDLAKQASLVWYTPPRGFRGIDELRVQLETLTTTAFVRVLPVNHAPAIEFLLDRMSEHWHSKPIRTLPAVQLDDADLNDLLTVRVQAENASILTESPIHPMFDGISRSDGDADVLELTASVERLKPLFASRFIEIGPQTCGRDSDLCAGLVKACVSDGLAPSVCAEVAFPRQPQHFSIDQGDDHNETEVVAGEDKELADLFRVTERSPADVKLTLELTLSTGSLRYKPSPCADWYGPRMQRSTTGADGDHFTGTTYSVTAPDLGCLSTALKSSALRTAKRDQGLARIGLELLANGTRSLLRKDIWLSVTPAVEPDRRINVIPAKDTPIQVRAGDRLDLASLFSFPVDYLSRGQDAMVDLTVACVACTWSYDYFVPRVSYEFAALPSSNLTLTGPMAAITDVFNSLKFVASPVPVSSGGVDNITVAARDHLDVSGLSAPVFVPLIVEKDPLRWRVLQSSFVVHSRTQQATLEGIEIVGKADDSALPLRLRIRCIEGSAVLIVSSDTRTPVLCGLNEDPVAVATSRDQINHVLASIVVEDHPSWTSNPTRIEFGVTEKTQTGEDFVTTTVIIRWAGTKFPSLSLAPSEGFAVLANVSAPSPLGDVLLVDSGAESDLYSRLLTVRVSVAHGTLFVPMKVCCVEIHSQLPRSELVVSGEAHALMRALSATLYTGDAGFQGEDFLSASVALYGDPKWSELPATRVSIIVATPDADRALSTDPEWSQMATSDDRTGEWGDGEESAELTPTDAYLVPIADSELDEIEDDYYIDESDDSELENAEVQIPEQSLWPLLHIEGTLEDPLSTNSWEIPMIQADVGVSTPIAGVCIVTYEQQPSAFGPPDNVVLEVVADNGEVSLDADYDVEASSSLAAVHWGMSKRVMMVTGPLHSVNRSLHHLSYRCGYNCPLMDAVTLTIRHKNQRFEHRHERKIWVELQEPLPVPKVELDESVMHMTEEDTAFQFSHIALSGTPSQETTISASFDAPGVWGPEENPAWLSPAMSAAGSYTLDVTVSVGTISCTFEIAQCRDDRRPQSNAQTLSGSFLELSRALTTLTYQPPVNWNSEQHLGGHIVEWAFRVSDGTLVNETYAYLVVSPRVDPPVINVPSDLEDVWRFTTDHLSRLRLQCLPIVISEDAEFQFDGLSVRATDLSDKDEPALFNVVISVHHGTLSAGSTPRCVSRYASSGIAGTLAFTASLVCVNQVLNALTYTSSPHFSGADVLEIRVEVASTQENASFDTANIPLIVVEVNDAPYVTTAFREFYSCDEDDACVITDLKLIDPDSSGDGDRLMITIAVARGSIALLYSNDVAVSEQVLDPDGTNGMVLTVEGTLAHLSRAMSSLVFTSAKDWNSLLASNEDDGEWFDTISITATDFADFNSSTTLVLQVYVAPTADPVLIHPPSNLVVSAIDDEDSVQALRGDEDVELSIRGLAFFSVDETSRSTLFVRMSVAHGRLSLPVTRGISLEGNHRADTPDRELSLRGTFENVNRCVVFVRYHPDANYVGNDAFEVEARAFDEYTREETPTAAMSVPIVLQPVNDPPSWVVLAPSVAAQLDEPTLISGVSLFDVDVTGVDCRVVSCVMDVTIEAMHGFVTLPRLSQPALFSTTTAVATDGTPLQRSSFLVISGIPSELNAALAEIVFELNEPEYYRADAPIRSLVGVSLSADDRGNFGKGGPKSSTATVFVRPIAWTEHRLLLAVPHYVLNLQEDRSYAFDGAVRIYDSDAARSHQAVLEVDVRCGHGNFVFRPGARGVQVLTNDSHRVVVRGFLQALNDALNSSTYVPDRDWFGSDELSISVRDVAPSTGNRSIDASMFVFVAPVCDPPCWTVSWGDSNHLEAVEDELLVVDMISLASADVSAGDEREVKVVVSVRHGVLMLAKTDGLLVTDREFYTNSMGPAATNRLISSAAASDGSLGDSRLFLSSFQVTGSVGDINAALAGLVYKPHRDYNSDNGTSCEEISLVAWVDCDGQMLTGGGGNITLPVFIRAARDPIALLSKSFHRVDRALPPEQMLSGLGNSVMVEAFEDTQTPLERLELVDFDDPEEVGLSRFKVSILCWHCSVARPPLDGTSELMYLTPSTPLIEDDTSVWSPQLVVVGGAKALNRDLLSSLSFVGSRNFSGLAAVTVTVDVLGVASSANRGYSIAYALPVRVLEVDNDAPEILMPDIPMLVVEENSSVLLRGVEHPALASMQKGGQQRQHSVVRVCPWCADSSSRQQPIQVFARRDPAAVSYLTPLGTTAFVFSAHHPTLGAELWKSDGTEAGTSLLKDILPGNGSSSPSFLSPFSVDGRVYFSASGPDLWWMLDADRLDDCRGFYQSRSFPGAYYAVAQLNVWDPDEAYDCPVGFHWMSTAEARAAFTGTEMLGGADTEPLAYFDQCGWRGYEWGGDERAFFRLSDSKTTGAYKHAGYRDSYHVETNFQLDRFAGAMCARDPPGRRAQWGRQLWSTDGTARGTRRVARPSSGSMGAMPSQITEHSGRLFFQASTLDYGAELWSTDGTREGTQLVADIEPGVRGSAPMNLASFAGRILFSARTERTGRELWSSDGLPTTDYDHFDHSHVATRLVLDICEGSGSSDPTYLVALSTLSGAEVVIFQADDCVHGPELWVSDGSPLGTAMLADIRSGSVGSTPRYLMAYASQVYFQADDGVHGAEVWATDGTPAGTVMLLDLAPGASGSGARYFSVFGSGAAALLLFAARADRTGREEFWLSDGTAAGTTRLFPGSEEVSRIDAAAMDMAVGPALVSVASDAFFYLGVDGETRFSSAGNSSESHSSRSMLVRETPGLGPKRYSLTLQSGKGWFRLGRECNGVDADGAYSVDARAHSITLEGRIADLNCAVQEVTFNSLPEQVGRDEIVVTLEDKAAGGSGLSTTARLPVQIIAVNSPPVITMSARYFAPLDGWVSFAGLDMTDPDAGHGMLYLRVAVQHGEIRVSDDATALQDVHLLEPTALGLLSRADRDGKARALEFAVAVAQSKALLGSLEYRCSSDRSGCRDGTRDYLAVDVSDNGFSGEGGPQVAAATALILVQDASA